MDRKYKQRYRYIWCGPSFNDLAIYLSVINIIYRITTCLNPLLTPPKQFLKTNLNLLCINLYKGCADNLETYKCCWRWRCIRCSVSYKQLFSVFKLQEQVPTIGFLDVRNLDSRLMMLSTNFCNSVIVLTGYAWQYQEPFISERHNLNYVECYYTATGL